jgi:hypothetical protein
VVSSRKDGTGGEYGTSIQEDTPMVAEAATLESVIQRLAAVERQNRFFRRVVAGGLVAVLLLLGMFLRVSRDGTVEAREFVVRDGQGNRRAVWTTTSQGISVLHLLDREGAARATLSVTPEGDPTLALTDHDERSLAAMAITNEGPALGLYDKDHEPLIAAP